MFACKSFTILLVLSITIGVKGEKPIRELIPLEAPENLTLIDIEDRDVVIKWDPVTPESVRGTFRGYLVRVWNHGTSQVYAIPPDVTRTNVQFFPFSKNFITVSVRNDKYVGPRSDAISFDAPETEPNFPFLYEWYQLGAHSILLQWSKPTQPNGVLLGYNIYVSEMTSYGIDAKSTNSYFVDADESQVKIPNLRTGIKYKVDIAAVNCAGESEHNSLEVELEDHEPYAPSLPFFKFKLNYNNTAVDYRSKCDKNPKARSTDHNKYFDDFGGDYYMFSDSSKGKIAKTLDQNNQTCFVNCLIKWIPDIDNNPGENFYVKYRMKDEKTFHHTEEEHKNDFLVLENFNACKSYEVILVAVDGEFETESDAQETPAIMFMKKY